MAEQNIKRETDVLSTCAALLFELYDADPDAAMRIGHYLTCLLMSKMQLEVKQRDSKMRLIESNREKLKAELAMVEKVQEAELLGCVKTDDTGKAFIDYDEYLAKRTNPVQATLPVL